MHLLSLSFRATHLLHIVCVVSNVARSGEIGLGNPLEAGKVHCEGGCFGWPVGGHFACNLGSTAKAICLSWNILVAKGKALPLLDSGEAASYILAGHCCQ